MAPALRTGSPWMWGGVTTSRRSRHFSTASSAYLQRMPLRFTCQAGEYKDFQQLDTLIRSGSFHHEVAQAAMIPITGRNC